MESELTLSVWDRLHDEDPSHQDLDIHQEADLERYRELVRRDVEFLLNARREYPYEEKDYPLSSESAIAYGLKDLSSFDLNREEDRIVLTQCIRNSLER